MRLKTWLNVLAALGLGLVMAIPGTAENAAGVWPVAGLSGVPSRIVDGAHLNIPFVTVLGGAAYTHVVVTVRSIVGVAGGLQTLAEDQYNPATGQLTIPAVFAYGKVYTNVVVTVGTVVSFGS